MALLVHAVVLILVVTIAHCSRAQELRPEVDPGFSPSVDGMKLSADRAPQNSAIALTLFFKNNGSRAARRNYRVFVHFEFPEPTCRDIIFGADHAATKPTSLWAPGERVKDGPVLVRIPSHAPNGKYHVHVGLFAPMLPGGPRLVQKYVGTFVVDHEAPVPECKPAPLSQEEIDQRKKNLAAIEINGPQLTAPGFAFRIDPATGQYKLTDRRSGVTWYSDIAEKVFGIVSLTNGDETQSFPVRQMQVAETDDERIVLRWHPPAESYKLAVRFTIAKVEEPAGIRIRYDAECASDWRVASVRLLKDAFWTTDVLGGYLAVAHRLGILLPAKRGIPYVRSFHAYANANAYSMAMCGVVKEGSALLVTWDAPYARLDVASRWVDDPSIPGAQAWSVSVELSHDARSVAFYPLGKGSYADVARTYRVVARQKGLLKTWDQKRKEGNPVDRLFGAADFKPFVFIRLAPHTRHNPSNKWMSHVGYTFDEAAEIAEHLRHDVGIDKAMFVLAGWIHRGYDNQHPDILPPAPECGGEKGLIECARRVKACGYLFGLHDNYQDMYRDAPSWDESYLMRDRNGHIRKGGVWAGGQAYLICSRRAIELAKRPQNLPAVARLFSPTIYFIDTTFAAPPFECYAPQHPITKTEDIFYKKQLSMYARKLFGLFGSEEGQEWAVPCADYFEGLMSHKNSPQGDIVIPLFPLVYHDCVSLYTHQGDRATPSRTRYVLNQLLYGEMPLYQFGEHLYFKADRAGGPAVRPSLERLHAKGPWTFEITYKWETSRPLASNFRCFVHFVSPKATRPESIAFQDDHDFAIPTTQWKAVEPIIDGPRTVEVPKGLTGTVEILVGLTDKGRRVPLIGESVGNLRYRIGTIHIAENGEVSLIHPSHAIYERPFAAPAKDDPLCQTDRFIKNSYAVLSTMHRIVGPLPMTDHAFLTDDRTVERTQFGKNAEIVVNFGEKDYRFGDTILPANGFLARSSRAVAFFARQWRGQTFARPLGVVIQGEHGEALSEAQKVNIYCFVGWGKVKLFGKEVELKPWENSIRIR